MFVIGIDPGVNNIGFACTSGTKIVCSRSVRIKKNKNKNLRYKQIYEETNKFFLYAGYELAKISEAQHVFKDTKVVIESSFFGGFRGTIEPLARVQGIAIAICCAHNCEYSFVAPREWKKKTLDNGKATKENVASFVWMVAPFKNCKDYTQDEMDAIAIAMSYHFSEKK